MQLEKCLMHVKVLKLFILFGAFSTIIVLMIYSLSNFETISARKFNKVLLSSKPIQIKIAPKQVPTFNGYGNGEMKTSLVHRSRDKIKRLSLVGPKNGDPVYTHKLPKYSMQNIHIFYTIPVKWYHSNDDIGSSILDSNANRVHNKQPNIVFYPMLGLYLPDTKTIQHHLKNIELLGSAVLIITWSPRFQKYLLKQLFDEVKRFNLKIAIEIDDYPNRTAYSLLNDIEYFHREFWNDESLYKVLVASQNLKLPMFYIKNVATLTVSDWSSIFSPNGFISIRGSPQDATFIGHISTKKHVALIKTANFNGFYNRNVSNGATYASSWKYWETLKKTADKFKLVFIPTVGPGYNENRKQPKNKNIRRHRTNGQYYGVAWRSAMMIGAEFIIIHSFNDWISGTQIEEAMSKSGFEDYSPGTPNKYLDLTRYWINEYILSWKSDTMKRTVDAKNCAVYFNNTIC